MRALMGVIADRHGTYYARRKVPKRVQEAVVLVLGNGKTKQTWLKKSLGTKDLKEANVRAKPVLMQFDQIIAQAEAQLKERPIRTSISDTEIKRIAEYAYAHELAADEELREDGLGDDPMAAEIHRQLTEAGVEFNSPFKPDELTLEKGAGLSTHMMHKIEETISIVLPAARAALARGDTKFIKYELDELLKVFQINLDPNCADYRKLARAVTAAHVKALEAIAARQKGEPVDTPLLLEPSATAMGVSGSLREALVGWQKERSPSKGVFDEYDRAVRLFTELHGDIPVAQIKRTHARMFREALQDLPRHRPGKLLSLSLPELAEWGRKHPQAPKITAATANKLLGGVQTIARWAYDKGMVPDEVNWSDPFANMRLPEDAPERDAFTIAELNGVFASPVFAKGERPKAGRGETAFWFPLLGLYTGARRAELAALTVKDIQKVDDVSTFVFVEEKATGKNLKTRASARTVPIHPQLVKLGWLTYVESMRIGGGESAWLFPEVAPKVTGGLKAWTKWFTRYLRNIGVTDRHKVFHSFRHVFKDALRTAGVSEDLNDALTGHSNTTVGRRYGAKEIVRRFGMQTLRRAIVSVTYKGLKVPKMQSKISRKRRRR
jgi:integrase